ncbi:hypothetical protein R69888_05281 [Paraburkholderia haematera]|uniref:Uncharacterized protein n=1 Tax=Paraburkholderia haematera TaxID=2793077 RepID=A0ABM8SDC0_9BURK|nr:hypothetical protein R69888_05281 [Paraburkholderia haematera]
MHGLIHRAVGGRMRRFDCIVEPGTGAPTPPSVFNPANSATEHA